MKLDKNIIRILGIFLVASFIVKWHSNMQNIFESVLTWLHAAVIIIVTYPCTIASATYKGTLTFTVHATASFSLFAIALDSMTTTTSRTSMTWVSASIVKPTD